MRLALLFAVLLLATVAPCGAWQGGYGWPDWSTDLADEDLQVKSLGVGEAASGTSGNADIANDLDVDGNVAVGGTGAFTGTITGGNGLGLTGNATVSGDIKSTGGTIRSPEFRPYVSTTNLNLDLADDAYAVKVRNVADTTMWQCDALGNTSQAGSLNVTGTATAGNFASQFGSARCSKFQPGSVSADFQIQLRDPAYYVDILSAAGPGVWGCDTSGNTTQAGTSQATGAFIAAGGHTAVGWDWDAGAVKFIDLSGASNTPDGSDYFFDDGTGTNYWRGDGAFRVASLAVAQYFQSTIEHRANTYADQIGNNALLMSTPNGGSLARTTVTTPLEIAHNAAGDTMLAGSANDVLLAADTGALYLRDSTGRADLVAGGGAFSGNATVGGTLGVTGILTGSDVRGSTRVRAGIYESYSSAADTVFMVRDGYALVLYREATGSVDRETVTTDNSGDPGGNTDVDIIHTFEGGTNDGEYRWDSGQNRFEFNKLVYTASALYAALSVTGSQGVLTNDGYSVSAGTPVATVNAFVSGAHADANTYTYGASIGGLGLDSDGAWYLRTNAAAAQLVVGSLVATSNIDTAAVRAADATASYAIANSTGHITFGSGVNLTLQGAGNISGVGSLTAVNAVLSGQLRFTGIVSKATGDSPYAVAATDATIVVDASGGNLSITLPAATGSGRVIYFKASTASGANTVTLDAATNGALIDGAGTNTLVLDAQWDTVRIIDAGTNVWYIIG